MKKQLFYFILPLLLLACNDSNNSATNQQAEKFFQGELHYTYTYQSQEHNIPQLRSIRPKRSVFRFDKNHYQSTFYGADTISYYYSGIHNVAISSINMSFDVKCQDYGINPDTLLSSNVYNTDELVVGYPCKVVEFETPNSFNRYHVSTEIFLPPGTYKRHEAYNWAFYGEQTNGGIILRMENQFKDFTMISEITNIGWFRDGQKAWTISPKVLDKACK